MVDDFYWYDNSKNCFTKDYPGKSFGNLIALLTERQEEGEEPIIKNPRLY